MKKITALYLVAFCLFGAAGSSSARGTEIAAKAAKAASDDKADASSKGAKKQAKGKEKKMTSTIYDYKAKALSGEEIDLSKYKGDVVLIVNTASKCGYTPQYAGLEELNKKYSGKGLTILGFPCNQFGAQEPGEGEEIATFCQRNYGVDFQMFDKIDVNGKHAHPLYQFLTGEAAGAPGDIKWNFTKFLVDRNGKVIKRYESKVEPKDIAPDIEKQLAVTAG